VLRAGATNDFTDPDVYFGYTERMDRMLRKLILAVGCLALLASASSIARADAISFSFLFSPNPVHADASGLTAGPALVLLVSDTKIPAVFGLIGSAAILTGPASLYSATGTTVTANYMPGSGVEVEADSASCVGGSMPGICLQGILNSNGKYVGTLNSTGSFQALYTVTYVSLYITSLFFDPNAWLPTGSVVLPSQIGSDPQGRSNRLSNDPELLIVSHVVSISLVTSRARNVQT
jgi:hypothetical protein